MSVSGSSSSAEYLLNVGFGISPGIRRAVALGNNPSMASVPADIWTGGGAYPWITVAAALEIVSSSASDAAAGTGARTVLISGLDASYAEISETVTLNGTTAVATVNSYFRVQSMLAMTTGTNQTNVGTLTLRDTGAGTSRAIIPIGYGITRQSQFTTPAGWTLQILSSLFCINRPSSSRDITVATFIRAQNGTFRLPLELSVDGNPYRHDGVPGIIVPEKTDFGFRCTAQSAVNTDLTAAWLGVLRRN